MHPLTVYGIETLPRCPEHNTSGVACTLLPFTVLKHGYSYPPPPIFAVACTLLPFTVLKQNESSFVSLSNSCMHPLTVYGIETWMTLGQIKELSCMHPLTVYGIETTSSQTPQPMRIVACTLLPFTVLKLNSALARATAVSGCMHPLTVYGIETFDSLIITRTAGGVACTLLPFTVLKPQCTRESPPLCRCMHPLTVYGIETSLIVFSTATFSCMHPLTVYGIETRDSRRRTLSGWVACTLLPFTVLKLQKVVGVW